MATNGYVDERRAALGDLDQNDLDGPIVDVVQASAALPHCLGSVRYRIAYVAFCIENSDRGRAFLDRLSRIPSADPAYLQF